MGKRGEAQYVLFQGSAWPWLLGSYIDALLNVYSHPSTAGNVDNAGSAAEDKQLFQEYLWRKGLQVLVPFQSALQERTLGMIGAAYDGDAPHQAGYDIASALSVGEILRIYSVLAHMGVRHQVQALSA